MNPKLLTESGLKAVLSKNKIKDNGLQKALSAYEKLDDDAHDECLDQLAQIGKLATALKKVKEVAANKDVAGYLEDLLDAKDSDEKDVSKDKANAAKTDAANKKAQKQKDDDKEDDEDDEEDDEDDDEQQGEYGDQLLTAFRKLKTLNGSPLSFVFCDARPFPAIMVAKRIGSKHRKQLTEVTGGSKKFLHVGECHFEDGKYIFNTDQKVPGLARRLQLSVKNYTGKKFKFAHGGETAGDEEGDVDGAEPQADESSDANAASTPQDQASPQGDASPASSGTGPAAKPQDSGAPGQVPQGKEGQDDLENTKGPFSIGGAVGRGGKNKPEDVQAVQAALNKQARAGLKVDGNCDQKTIAAIMAFQKTFGQGNPDGVVSPGRGTARALAGLVKPGPTAAPPAPVAPPTLPKGELTKAPDVWNKTRDILKTNIDELKKAVKGHYASEHPDLVKQIDQGLNKFDGILKTLDTTLTDSLRKAAGAGADAGRKAELQNSKRILTEYIKYVKAEPLIAHIDKNPFGVDTNLKKVLTDSLTHMAQAIA
jgi:uncharacterized protein YukE